MQIYSVFAHNIVSGIMHKFRLSTQRKTRHVLSYLPPAGPPSTSQIHRITVATHILINLITIVCIFVHFDNYGFVIGKTYGHEMKTSVFNSFEQLVFIYDKINLYPFRISSTASDCYRRGALALPRTRSIIS